MVKTLKNYELNYVSGGLVCDATYDGKPFLKAGWYRSGSAKDAFGKCYYEDMEGTSVYVIPSNLTKGIVQKPMNFWSYTGNSGSYSCYECHRKDPNKCVFEDA